MGDRRYKTETTLTVQKQLRMGKNAVMTTVGSDGTESTVDLNELGVLDGLTATTAELNILDGVTATADEINQHCDESANVEVVATTNVITASESGKTFFLNLAGGFTSTLPAPAAGLRYKFIVATAPTTAYIIATNGGDNIMIGSVSCSTADDAGASDANADVINFVASQAIVGDWIELISDGTSWFFSGNCFVAEGITTATT